MNALISSIDPVAFPLFGLEIKWYGLVIVAGMIAALFLFFYLSKDIGLKQDDGITLFLIVIPVGIVCARIGYVISHIPDYFPILTWSDFFRLFATWEGGVTIIGGIAGGTIAAILYARKKKINIIELLGAVGIPVLLGQAIGRWGNFFNQELYGPPVADGSFFARFPLGVFIDGSGWHYSTVTYESVLSFIGVCLLLLLYKGLKTKKKVYFKGVEYKGTVFFGYIAWYFMSRALVEPLRVDQVKFGNFPLSLGVIISLLIVPIAVVLGIIYYRNGTLKYLTFKKVRATPGDGRSEGAVNSGSDTKAEAATGGPKANTKNAGAKANKDGKPKL